LNWQALFAHGSKTGTLAKRYFLSEHAGQKPMHGGIGNHDIDVILEREGYEPIRFPSATSFGPLAKLKRFGFLCRMLMNLPADAIIAFQYPVDAKMAEWAIRAINNGRRKIICIVTDIDGIKDSNEKKLKKDLERLKKFRNFIVHNPSMQRWLQEHGVKGKFACLGLFDYLTTAEPALREHSLEVIYAGNLGYRPFLKRLHELEARCPNVQFHLYGPAGSIDLSTGGNIVYHGISEAHELPPKLVGSYGLIWEGDSIATLHGGFSEYLKYISPHKLSMYIAAGIPVICHPEMAIAGFVTGEGIGIAVTDLSYLEYLLAGIGVEQYETMRNHCLRLRPRVIAGRCLAAAMTELLVST
jgi:hypothetical protein